MKTTIQSTFLAIICTFSALIAKAEAPVTYELTIHNGSQMPISPGTLYVKDGSESAAPLGSEPTTGFIALCQTGNPTLRFQEVKSNASVKFAVQTMGPIAPGASLVIEVQATNPAAQSLHFEAMYGKTKDVCGIATIGGHSLFALKQHVSTEAIQKDSTVLTGSFKDPTLPQGMSYLEPSVCANAADAISCLRELATPNPTKAQIRFFAGYFPSLVSSLEQRYGSSDVQTLLFPSSGAIQLKLKLKH